MRYQFEIYQLKILSFFKIGGGAVLLLWAHALSPLWHKSPKTESLEPLILLSPLWQIKHMSEDYTKDGVLLLCT
jgi:hypothetical protein